MSRKVIDSYSLIKVGEEADLAPAQDQARDKINVTELLKDAES